MVSTLARGALPGRMGWRVEVRDGGGRGSKCAAGRGEDAASAQQVGAPSNSSSAAQCSAAERQGTHSAQSLSAQTREGQR